jgi:hypothetical protein
VFEVNARSPVVLSGLTITQGEAPIPFNPPDQSEGGGILNLSTLTLSGCVVSGNAADAPAPSDGGGIYNAGTMTIIGCTVSGNVVIPDLAPGNGGGISNAGTMTITGNTLSANETSGYGQNIFNAGNLTISTSNFYSDSPDNIYGSYTDGGGNTFGPVPGR